MNFLKVAFAVLCVGLGFVLPQATNLSKEPLFGYSNPVNTGGSSGLVSSSTITTMLSLPYLSNTQVLFMDGATGKEVSGSNNFTFNTSTGLLTVLNTVSSSRLVVGNGVDAPAFAAVIATSTDGATLDVHTPTHGAIYFTNDASGRTLTDGAKVALNTTAMQLINYESGPLQLGVGGAVNWRIDSTNSAWRGEANNTYDIGTASIGVRTVYASTSVQMPAGSASAPTIAFVTSTTGIYGTGAAGANMNIAFSGTSAYLITSSVLRAVGNNTKDLGANNAAWKDSYASGTAYGANMWLDGTVTSTGARVYMPNLNALGATGDFVCQNNTTNYIETQLANCTVSSIWFKEHVKSLSAKKMLAMVNSLRSVEYDMKADGHHEKGFIAEEVARIDPSLVVFEETKDQERINYIKKLYPDVVLIKDGKTFLPKTVDYMRLTVIEAGAIQSLDERLTKLEKSK